MTSADHLGWEPSAEAWIATQGETGDKTRVWLLDAPMLQALPASGQMIDIGCGEGRFCRMMQARGLQTIGIETAPTLIETARNRDPAGQYIMAGAEALPLGDASSDGAVFYMSLIDIQDYHAAIAEAARVLRPGGKILVANLPPWSTARPRNWPGEGGTWIKDQDGDRRHWASDDMLEERGNITSWAGIRMVNYHRPLSAYMSAFLGAGLVLRQFLEPRADGPDAEFNDKFNRMPWAYMMVWEKGVTR